MKKTIIAFALCALCSGLNAQTVTVADVEALPGETVAFSLNLTGGKADTYTAMQFDAQFPATGFSTTGKYSVSEFWPNATATIGAVDGNGTATIPIASSEAIGAADIEGLFSLSFTVGSDVAVGEYDVTLKNIWFGYGTSGKDYIADVTFKVKVVSVHTVVLDENATTAPAAATGVNVLVKRTIKAGEWSTLCLPFDMTANQLKAAFGDNVQVADFTSWSPEEEDGAIVGLNVGFKSVTAIEANHPYIIKVGEAVSEFTVDGVDIEVEDEPTVQVGKKSSERGWMHGTYTATKVPEENVFLSGNKFWYSTGKSPIKAFRAYFEFKDVLDSYYDATEARITISLDGETTGITSMFNVQWSLFNDIYDLQGRKVSVGAGPVPARKGLYIKDGKKVFVK